MPRIDIDEEIYAKLEENARGFEKPNDVLRRLLLDLDENTPSASLRHVDGRGPGALKALLDVGLIRVGDQLTHVQSRKGRTFHGTVRPDGTIQTSEGIYRTPSRALGDLVGTPIDGWHRWIHDRSKKSLRDLRAEAGGTGRRRA